MVEAGIRTNEVFLRSFFVRCDAAEQNGRISYDVSARLNGNVNLSVVLFRKLITNFSNLLEKITRLRHFLTVPISHSKASSNINLLHLIKVFQQFKSVSHGLQDDFFIGFLHVGPYMLMQTHYMNVVLFGYFNCLMEVVFIDAELALRTTSNHMVAASCSHLRIDPQIYIFPS